MYIAHLEFARFCSAELEKRALGHPELLGVQKYRTVTQPRRQAKNWLQSMDFLRRAEMADEYGLKVLAWWETRLSEEAHQLLEITEKKYGFADKRHMEIATSIFRSQCRFPDFEIELMTQDTRFHRGKEKKFSIELKSRIKRECELLIQCAMLKLWGQLPKDYHQDYYPNTAFEEIWQATKTSIFPTERKYLRDAEVRQEARGALFHEVAYLANKEFPQIVISGLKGELKDSLKRVTEQSINTLKKRESRQGDKVISEVNLLREEILQESEHPSEPKSQKRWLSFLV